MSKSVFLSHSSQDKVFVRALAERLEEYGVKVWLDEAEIKIGDSLINKISQGIEESDCFCIVLSSYSITSTWVQKELEAALHKEFLKKEVIVLPVLLDYVELPVFLSDKFYADFTTAENYNNNFSKLLKALDVSHAEKRDKQENNDNAGHILFSGQLEFPFYVNQLGKNPFMNRAYNAIWDTGATRTAISERIAKELNFPIVSKQYINTANGMIQVPLHCITIGLPDRKIIPEILVVSCILPSSIDALIGMDIITRGDFSISTSNGKVSVSYNMYNTEETIK